MHLRKQRGQREGQRLNKTAFKTEGSIFRSHIGTGSRGLSSRVGWAEDDSTCARVYLRGSTRDKSEIRFDYSDQWDNARAVFRLDERTSSMDLLSFSAEAFYSHLRYAYYLADLARAISVSNSMRTPARSQRPSEMDPKLLRWHSSLDKKLDDLFRSRCPLNSVWY